MNFLFGAVVGFVIGAFTPAVGRKIKEYFVKKTANVVPAVEDEVKKFL